MRQLNIVKLTAIIATVCNSLIASGQGKPVNTAAASANNLAIYDSSSVAKSVSVPRMTTAQRTAISSPASGLLVYQTDATAGFYLYTGSEWVSLNSYTDATTQNDKFSPARKNNLYADAGICLAYLDPGSSVTYNYNFNKHLSLGAGVQEYSFHTTVTNVHQLTSALFGEFRFNMRRRKKGQYFLFLDIGEDFYKHNDSYYRDGDITYTVPNNNGVYSGLGFGYTHYTTKRRGGPYVSLKLIQNHYTSDTYDAVSNERSSGGSSDGTLVVSVGFKF